MKRTVLILIVVCILAPMMFGVTRHTPEDRYFFKRLTIFEDEPIDLQIQLIDPYDDVNNTSGSYPGNYLETSVDLPTGLILSPIEYVDCNDPNDLCAIANLSGSLSKGDYEILFTIRDKAGNDENAWLGIEVKGEDTTPPKIGCGGF